MANPSIVNDDSGNNYGGIKESGGMEQAYAAYLNNLFKLTKSPAMQGQRTDTYFPSAGEDIQVGAVSNKTMGSMPLFAAGTGLIPFGILDELSNERKKAEIEYYKNLDIDKPLYELKEKLSAPWLQDDFNLKVQNSVDTWLNEYASRFGGDYMKAQKALRGDKNFTRMIQSYDNYAATYNMAYAQATQILEDAKSPDKKYVSDEMLAATKKFLFSHENLDDLSVDQLVKGVKEFRSQVSVYQLADMATKDYGDRVTEKIEADYNKSNDKYTVYQKVKKVGPSEEEIQNLITTTLKTNPWIEKDPAAKSMLETEVRNRLNKGYELSLDKVEKDTYDRIERMKKNGVPIDDKGNVQFRPITSSFGSANPNNPVTGSNGVVYPKVDGKTPTIAAPTGITLYVMDGSLVRRIKLPDALPMEISAEYDANNKSGIGVKGRYIEGNMNFNKTGVFQKAEIEEQRNSSGKIVAKTPTGEYQGSVDVSPTFVFDELNSEWVNISGFKRVMGRYDDLGTYAEGAVPDLAYIHGQLPKSSITTPNNDRPMYAPDAVPGTPIQLADLSSFTPGSVDKNKTYQVDGVDYTGQELIDMYNEANKK